MSMLPHPNANGLQFVFAVAEQAFTSSWFVAHIVHGWQTKFFRGGRGTGVPGARQKLSLHRQVRSDRVMPALSTVAAVASSALAGSQTVNKTQVRSAAYTDTVAEQS